MERALITGASGFIGQRLWRELEDRGWAVEGVDMRALQPVHRCDITDADAVRECVRQLRPDVVFHLAAQFDVAVSKADPVADATVNVLGTLHVAQAANAAGARKVVFPSSGLVYGSPRDGQPNTEDDCPDPRSPYAVAKVAATQYLQLMTADGGPEHAVLVLGNVYGPRGDNVVTTVARRMHQGEPVTIDRRKTRDFVHVDDVVRAMALAGEVERSIVCNVASGVETSLAELYRMLTDPLGAEHQVTWRDGSNGDRLWLSYELARAALGWQPTISLSAGLQTVVDWLRA
jgi:UDP-glucose 4-epimerase